MSTKKHSHGFIKLTTATGAFFHIRPSHIAQMNYPVNIGPTHIITVNGENYGVRESPDNILALIELMEAKAEC